MSMLFLRCCCFFVVLCQLTSQITGVVVTEYVTKIVCFGQRLRLVCRLGRTLEIYGAAYETLEKTSQLCRHYRGTSSGCTVRSHMTRLVQSMCDGRGECFLGYGAKDQPNTINCHASMYFNISYRCSRTSATPRTRTEIMAPPIREEDGGSLYFVLLRFFVDVRNAGEYMERHSLWLILCLVSSFSTGILVLIIYALLFKFYCTKCHAPEQSSQEDVSIGNVEAVSPVGEDTNERLSNGVGTGTPNAQNHSAVESVHQHVKERSTDGTNQRDATGNLRRVASVNDERTQSNGKKKQTTITGLHSRIMTVNEIQELGSLVADLNFYASEIEDPFEIMEKPGPSGATAATPRNGYDKLAGKYDNVLSSAASSSASSQAHNTPQSAPYRYEKIPFPTKATSSKSTSARSHAREPSGTPQSETSRLPSELPCTSRGGKDELGNRPQVAPNGAPQRHLRRFPSEISSSGTTTFANSKEDYMCRPQTTPCGTVKRETRSRPSEVSFDTTSVSEKEEYLRRHQRRSNGTPQREPNGTLQGEHNGTLQREHNSTPQMELRRYPCERQDLTTPRNVNGKYRNVPQNEPCSTPERERERGREQRRLPSETGHHTLANEQGKYVNININKAQRGTSITPQNERRRLPCATSYDANASNNDVESNSSGIHPRESNNIPQKELRRFPSEVSCATSISNASDERHLKESSYFGDPSKSTSMQRNCKLGIRGDGFEYIGGNMRPK